MKISVFGLGYVGCVSGACIAGLGHKVIGVDTNQSKVEMINNSRSPIIEERIQELIEDVVKKGLFTATSDSEQAIKDTDVAIICVGTPSKSNGCIDLVYVKRVSEHIGKALNKKKKYFVVCVRSTVFPGTVENTVIPILEEHSGKLAGKDFGVCMIPEFLREGSSVNDFYHPPKSVIGELDKKSGDKVIDLFSQIEAPLIRTKIKVAEMVKYSDNAFHALKITFANEIGNICKELDIDSHRVMDIFCKDNKLNLSPYYLKPGFAFGGSCLPKDLRAINYESKVLNVDIPVLSTILESNRRQILRVIKILMEFKGSSLGFLGLSFKGGTDDLRESPLVEVIETMIGKGFKVNIYDNNVRLARLLGSNKEYIEKEIPHISSLMCESAKALLNSSDVIIVGNFDSEYKKALFSELKEKQTVIDLARIIDDSAEIKGKYYGICW